MLVLELGPGQLDWEKLTACQQDATSGLYARAMAGFVRWLTARYEEVRSGLKEEHAALRTAASSSHQHKRTPGIVADLALGWRYFLLFACEAGALTAEQAEKLWAAGWKALGEAAAEQHQHQAAGEPTRRFGELLSAAVASGRAHLADPAGDEPASPEAWGWRLKTVGTGDYEREEWQPQGERIGWVDGEDLYLEPEASFAASQKQGRDSGDALTVTGRTLRKRLHERGLLASTDQKRQVLTVRRTLGGSRREILHTAKDFLSTHTDQPDQPDHDGEKPFTYADSTPPLWSGQDPVTRPTPDHEPDQERNGRVMEGGWSGRKQEPDHEPDQQKPDTYAGNSSTGRVGRVFDARGDQDGNGGVRMRREQGRSGGDKERCIHGYPSGIWCYLCDPHHPYRLKGGSTA